MAKENIITRARDELFSHINRCGVLQAEEQDQRHWMDETIDYLAERYPDLSDGDLQDLYSVGIRFCQPAIPHGRKKYGFEPRVQSQEPEAEGEGEATQESLVPEELVPHEELIPQEVGGENTLQES